MTRVSSFILGGLLLVLALGGGGAWAQGAVQARVDPAQSTLSASGDAVALRLSLSQPVPYRVRLLPNPPRVVMEFNTLDWQGLDWPKVAGAARLALRPSGRRLGADGAGPWLSNAARCCRPEC